MVKDHTQASFKRLKWHLKNPQWRVELDVCTFSVACGYTVRAVSFHCLRCVFWAVHAQYLHMSVSFGAQHNSHTPFCPPSHTLIQLILFQEDELDENKNLESLQSPPHHVLTLHLVSQ